MLPIESVSSDNTINADFKPVYKKVTLDTADESHSTGSDKGYFATDEAGASPLSNSFIMVDYMGSLATEVVERADGIKVDKITYTKDGESEVIYAVGDLSKHYLWSSSSVAPEPAGGIISADSTLTATFVLQTFNVQFEFDAGSTGHGNVYAVSPSGTVVTQSEAVGYGSTIAVESDDSAPGKSSGLIKITSQPSGDVKNYIIKGDDSSGTDSGYQFDLDNSTWDTTVEDNTATVTIHLKTSQAKLNIKPKDSSAGVVKTGEDTSDPAVIDAYPAVTEAFLVNSGSTIEVDTAWTAVENVQRLVLHEKQADDSIVDKYYYSVGIYDTAAEHGYKANGFSDIPTLTDDGTTKVIEANHKAVYKITLINVDDLGDVYNIYPDQTTDNIVTYFYVEDGAEISDDTTFSPKTVGCIHVTNSSTTPAQDQRYYAVSKTSDNIFERTERQYPATDPILKDSWIKIHYRPSTVTVLFNYGAEFRGGVCETTTTPTSLSDVLTSIDITYGNTLDQEFDATGTYGLIYVKDPAGDTINTYYAMPAVGHYADEITVNELTAENTIPVDVNFARNDYNLVLTSNPAEGGSVQDADTSDTVSTVPVKYGSQVSWETDASGDTYIYVKDAELYPELDDNTKAFKVVPNDTDGYIFTDITSTDFVSGGTISTNTELSINFEIPVATVNLVADTGGTIYQSDGVTPAPAQVEIPVGATVDAFGTFGTDGKTITFTCEDGTSYTYVSIPDADSVCATTPFTGVTVGDVLEADEYTVTAKYTENPIPRFKLTGENGAYYTTATPGESDTPITG